MTKVNIAEMKAKLSEYLEIAAQGERVLICKHNRPVAELRSVQAGRTEPRPIGGATGQFVVPASFFAPLPDDIVAGFMGATIELPTTVAGAPARYGAIRRPSHTPAKGRKPKGRARR